MKHYILLLTVVSILCACSGNDKNVGDVPDFASAEPLVADSVAVNEIIDPSAWQVIGNKILLSSSKSEKPIWVYSLPDFKFMYSYGNVGEGPDDFSSYPTIIRSPKEKDVFQVVYRNKLKKYSLADTSAVRLEADTLLSVSQNTSIADGVGAYHDSIFISLSMEIRDGELVSWMQAYNGSSKVKADSLPSYMFSDWKVSEKGYSGGVHNFPLLIGSGDKLVVVYNDVYRVEIYRVEKNGALTLLSATGDLASMEQIKAMPWSKTDVVKNSMLSMPVCDEKYIYTFPVEVKAEKNENGEEDDVIQKSYMAVYDWDGHLVKTFAFDKKIDQATVDTKNNKVFGYNSNQDFEKVYVYDIKI